VFILDKNDQFTKRATEMDNIDDGRALIFNGLPFSAGQGNLGPKTRRQCQRKILIFTICRHFWPNIPSEKTTFFPIPKPVFDRALHQMLNLSSYMECFYSVCISSE